MSDAKEHPDKHLIETLVDWFPGYIRSLRLNYVNKKVVAEIKSAIKKDEEAHRLFCKEIVRKKIEEAGKPVEGSEFNNKP